MATIAQDQLAALAEALRPMAEEFSWDTTASDAQAAVTQDDILMQDLGSRRQAASLLRLWSGPVALVAPRHFARKPGFAAAVAESAVPVALRASGGMVVLHGPPFINITQIVTKPKGSALSVDRLYAGFGTSVFRALAQLGVAAEYQRIAQAYCSGRYDIAVGGRKLAGTAAMVRRCAVLDAHLVHATLRLWPIPGELAAITAFERKLGFKPAYDAHFLTSLTEEMARHSVPSRVV